MVCLGGDETVKSFLLSLRPLIVSSCLEKGEKAHVLVQVEAKWLQVS